MHLRDVIIQPMTTEKSEELRQKNVYTFEVDKRANKMMISQAIHLIYGKKPTKVNVLYRPSKKKRGQGSNGRTSLRKKTYVFFDAKTSIDVFETT